MIKRLMVVLAVATASLAPVIPTGATECTPKGCTVGCHLNPDASIRIDPTTGTITIEPPIECYS